MVVDSGGVGGGKTVAVQEAQCGGCAFEVPKPAPTILGSC